MPGHPLKSELYEIPRSPTWTTESAKDQAMDLKEKLARNQTIVDLLKSERLRAQLAEAINKKKENDMYAMLNNYYGGKLSRNGDETVLKEPILESEEFKKLVVELINVIEE